MNTEIKTVRFNWYVNDCIVRLALKDKQVLNHYCHEQTDEGYASESVSFERRGDTILCWVTTSARDCEGRLDHYHDGFINIKDISKTECITFNWDSSQRDHTAESMNY